MANHSLLKSVTYCSGFLTMVLGISVVIGWHQHSLFLIQISHSWVPMQYNTAICFIFGGLALITLNKSLMRISQFVTILILILSGLTLIQYLMKQDLGIDQLFVTFFASLDDHNQGRMALNTSLSFLFIGCIFLLYNSSYITESKKFELGVNLIMLGLFLIGIINVIMAMTVRYSIFPGMQIAFNTLIGLIILSLGLMSFIYQNRPDKENNTLIITSLVIFIFLLLTFWVWQSIIRNQYEYFNKILQLKVQSLSTFINHAMQERATSFSRLASRWIYQSNITENEWQSDALQYVQDQPGFIAIELIDKSLVIRWVVPETGNERVKNFNLMQDSERRAVIEKVLQKKQLQMTKVTELIQGGRGIVLYSPIFKQNNFEGLMGGVINTQIMMNYVIHPQVISGYGIKIFSDNQLLYRSGKDDQQLYKMWIKKTQFSILGQTWEVELWPSAELFQQIMSSWLPLGTLILGIFISLLAGFLVRTLQLFKIGSMKLNALRLELADANERLNGILEGSSDFIAALDLNFNFITFNSAYKKEVYRVFKVNLQKGMNLSILLEKMSPENQQKTVSLWKKAFEGQSFTVIESFFDKRFRSLDFEIHFNPIKNATGELVGASHISTNVSYRMQNEKKLIESKKELEHMVFSLEKQNKELGLMEEMMNLLQYSNSIEDMIQPISTYIKMILTNTSGTIFVVDKEDPNLFKKNLGWGNPISDHAEILKSDCWALLRNKMHRVVVGEEAIACKHIGADMEQIGGSICQPLFVHGEMLGLIYMETDVEEATSKRMVYLLQILSEQIGLSLYNINLRDELRLQSTHDTLTGLYNRRFFEEYLQKEFLKTERTPTFFSILLIDIDHFKKINDSYGHLNGDKVLQSIANELSHHCRRSDVICRWGGEEFLLFLRDSTVDNIMPRAESIRKSVENLVIDIKGITIRNMTISVGIAFYPVDGEDLDSLIDEADAALYQAKEQGRNRIVISNKAKHKNA